MGSLGTRNMTVMETWVSCNNRQKLSFGRSCSLYTLGQSPQTFFIEVKVLVGHVNKFEYKVCDITLNMTCGAIYNDAMGWHGP